MKKAFVLGSCQTCKRVLVEIGNPRDLEIQDIKTNRLTASPLDELKSLAGSYEALFTRRSRKYTEWKLKDRELSESDIRDLILREYTFLKRPVFVIRKKILIGPSSSVVNLLKQELK